MKEDRNSYLKNQLFQKWVTTDSEAINDYWKKWMEQHPEQADEALHERNLLRGIIFNKYPIEPHHVESSWEKVNLATKTHYKINRSNNFIRYAAILLFFVAVAFGINYTNNSTSELIEAPVTMVEKHAERGIKLTVQLPDGSKIKLNSGSTLIYPENFRDDKREVQLIGEAYFDISKDESRPFIVQSANLITTVLGTKFTINANNKERIQVALISGSVKVEEAGLEAYDQDKYLYLEPGNKAVYASKKLSKEKMDKLMDTGWKDDIIAFRNNDINEAVAILGNWYGVDIQMTNADKITKSFNGIYEKEVLDNVLNSMAHAMNFTYKINNNKVIINGI